MAATLRTGGTDVKPGLRHDAAGMAAAPSQNAAKSS
jgi:hypothetical protein